MDGVSFVAVFMGFLKEGAWVPLSILVIAALIYLMLRDQKEQIKARQEESNKREDALNALVEANKIESREREEKAKLEAQQREERLMNHLDQQGAVQTRMVSTLEMIQIRMEVMERTLNLDPKVVVKAENTKDGGIIT